MIFSTDVKFNYILHKDLLTETPIKDMMRDVES